MSNISLEEIQNYIKNNPDEKWIDLDFDSFILNVKTDLSIEEKLRFVEAVIKDSFISVVTPSLLLNNVAFAINFVLAVCPDFPFPTKQADDDLVIDMQSSYDIIKSLDLINKYKNNCAALNNLYCELEKYVKDRMDYEKQKLIAYASNDNASADAVNTFSTAFYSLDKLINVAMNQLNKNGNKLFKKLTDKNISKWIGQFMELAEKIKPAVNGIYNDTAAPDSFTLHKSEE